MHQQQLLGQPANESALVDEVPIIITASKAAHGIEEITSGKSRIHPEAIGVIDLPLTAR
jgi:hypothetical protein